MRVSSPALASNAPSGLAATALMALLMTSEFCEFTPACSIPQTDETVPADAAERGSAAVEGNTGRQTERTLKSQSLCTCSRAPNKNSFISACTRKSAAISADGKRCDALADARTRLRRFAGGLASLSTGGGRNAPLVWPTLAKAIGP